MADTTFSMLTKGYLYKNLYKDAYKLIKKGMNDIEWDKDYWLHRVGLTTYKPARMTMSSIGLFALGALAGCAVGLALAPRPGSELRTQVKDKAMGLMGKAQQATMNTGAGTSASALS